MPFGGAGLERDAGAAEAAVEQQLHDQAAERVADQHGRLVERPDQRLVVVDDLVQAEPGELVAVGAELLDVAVLARPLGRGDGEAALAEVLREVSQLRAESHAPWMSMSGMRSDAGMAAEATVARPNGKSDPGAD